MDEVNELYKQQFIQWLKFSIKHHVATLHLIVDGDTSQIEEAVIQGLAMVGRDAYCDIHG